MVKCSHHSTTTHTLEMTQISEINQRLSDLPRRPAITAAAVGLEGGDLSSGSGPQTGTAHLVRLCWAGSPEFPDIHGHFSTHEPRPDESGADEKTSADTVVGLHTPQLLLISHRLGLRHVWGMGTIAERVRSR